MAFFGIRKTTHVATTRPADPDAVSRLAPFVTLSDTNMQRVLEAARIEAMPPRARLDNDPSAVAFLHQGRLKLESDGRPPLQLDHDDPAAAFALPADADWRITALGPCEVVKVPSRFMVLASAGGTDPELLDWQRAKAEDPDYQAFYLALKHGRCELPSLPDLARRIGAVIDDPTTASEDIARVIQSDPALAARVMSVVNSAAYNTGPAIGSLTQAVSRLGREQIRNLVFSFLVKSIYRTESAALKTRMRQLWAHSCHVGAIAAVLAKQTPGLDPERAMLAGLVHDIGVVPVLDKARDYPDIAEDGPGLERIISALRGEIGVQTMREWGFDKAFVDIAARAEDWLRPGEAVPDYLDVVLLAQLHAYIGTPRMAELPRIDQVPAFRKLAGGALSPRGSMAVIEDAQRDILALRRLLEGG